jgi:hypothetical protein
VNAAVNLSELSDSQGLFWIELVILQYWSVVESTVNEMLIVLIRW